MENNWNCECGTINQGEYNGCSSCGRSRDAEEVKEICSFCGEERGNGWTCQNPYCQAT